MLLQRIALHAREQPDRVALRWFPGTDALSYGQLDEALRRRAGALVRQGATAAEPLLVFGTNGRESILIYLAAMAAGCIASFMPLPAARFDPETYWRQQASLLGRLPSGTVVAPSAAIGILRRQGLHLPLRLVAQEDLDPHQPAIEAAPGTIALIQHSSGTTGIKKGVALGYAQIEAQVCSYAATLGFTAADVVVSWLPLYHDMGLIACLLLPLSIGATAVQIDPFVWTANPRLLFDAIEAHRGTHAWLPNFAFRHLERAVRRGATWNLDSLRLLVNCSEPCKPATFDGFAARFQEVGPGRLACCYAMAETVFAVTQSAPGSEPPRIRVAQHDFGVPGASVKPVPPGEPGVDLLSCGRPIAGARLRIEGGEMVFGEIEVSAPFLFYGYHRDPERTERVLHGGWYRTGDVGFLQQGELFVCGRLDDRINVSGRKVYAYEIESLVSDVDGVLPGRTVALGVFDDTFATERLVILYELRDGASAEEVSGRIVRTVDAAVRVTPADVVGLPPRSVIKTTSGKVDRQSNRLRYQQGGFRS